MKNKLYFISVSAVLLIPFVAPWEGAASVGTRFATKGVLFDQVAAATSFMPVLDLEMSGLDVRDAQNRPVRDAAAVQNLTALFMDSLFTLTVVSDTHSMSQIWSDLELFSRLFHNLIYNIFYPLQQAIPKALQPPTKRFVHNVHNLWTSLSVGIFLCTFLFANFFVKPSHQMLILRC